LKRVHLATSAALRHSSIFAVSSALLTLAPFALADDASPNGERRLGTVTVQAAQQSEVQAAKAKLDEVAGGTSLVTQAEVEKGRSATLEDTLAYQPGVYAQAAGGNDAIKISIRGSGANTSPGYFREGTKFLFDGLALTGAGGTPYELLDTQGLNYTEVLRRAPGRWPAAYGSRSPLALASSTVQWSGWANSASMLSKGLVIHLS